MFNEKTARQSGCCIRCGEKFSRTTSVIMVFEVYGRYQVECREKPVVIEHEWVAVCHNCASSDELARVANGHLRDCVVCGQRFLVQKVFDRYAGEDYDFNNGWGRYQAVTLQFCSSRCEQRWRRKMKQAKRPKIHCQVCRIEFQPKRSDSQFCSNACRQWAYRLRCHASVRPISE